MNQHGGDRKSEGRNQDSDTKVDIRYGENSEYLTARIARDRPDILERMKQGELQEWQYDSNDFYWRIANLLLLLLNDSNDSMTVIFYLYIIHT